MRRTPAILAALTLAAIAGCATQDDTGPVGDLELNMSQNAVDGTYTASTGELVNFRSVETSPGVIEISLEARGMMLMATMDLTGAMDLDVFSLANGQDTQILEADRTILDEFSSAVFDYDPETTFAPLSKLERISSLWGSWPETNVATRLVLAQANHSYKSLCDKVNQYVKFTHDGPGSWVGGCGRDNWDDKSTYYGLVNAEGACSGSHDGTRFSADRSSWRCYEPGHSKSMEYARGECFSQCGDGCGSPDYTAACGDHDSCVRFGHSLVSISCQDEFDHTVDDSLYAPVCK